MSSRLVVRRLKSPLRPIYRPQVIRLEERLPLGDALVGPLLATSWLGASLGSIPEVEAPRVLKKDSLAGLSLAAENGNFLCAGGLNDTGAVGAIEVASAPSRPILSGFADAVDVSTAPTAALRGSAGSLPERPVSLAEAPVAAPETTSLTPYFGRSGRAENVGLLPALASVRLAGHGGQGRETLPQRGAVPKEQVQANYAQRPISFEANVGQADASVQFLAHGPGYGLYLTGTEAVMVVSRGQGGVGQVFQPDWAGQAGKPNLLLPQAEAPATILRMQVLGGNATPRVMGEDPLPGKVNYFLGNDPSQWHSNISTFGKVEYQQVYPGIDMVFFGSGEQLEYDFVVAPGADPSGIRLGFTGADGVAVNGRGDLVVHAGGQDMVQHKPTVYQQVDGARQEIPSQFVLLDPPTSLLATRHSPLATPQVAFQLAPYDTSRPLVIDPVLSYSTYLGGSGGFQGGGDLGWGIAVDPTTGDALVTGETFSSDFPTANPWQPNLGGLVNAFVARLSADGSTLVFSTYLGGTDGDVGWGIAVDPNTGDLLVTGQTSSTDFPTVNPLQANLRGFENAFVARLSADGSALLFSTYLGGRYQDVAYGIAVDPTTGDALVTGRTNSPNFPTANPLQPNFGGGNDDAFVARLSADGSALVFSTYLGGVRNDYGHGIAVDPATGDVLVTGSTESPNFPVANPLQRFNRGGYDAFVARLLGDGSALVFSTYLGGAGDDSGDGIAVDPTTGDVFITGETSSSNFPTANPLQANNHGFNNAFVARLRGDGSALVYSTYLGGSNHDYGSGIAVDPTTGDALVTGSTESPNFPTANPLQANYHGGNDAFVARLNVDGSVLVFSTYLGGSNYDVGSGIAVDPTTGDVLATGQTYSPDFPTTPGAFQTLCGTDGNCNYDGVYYYSNVFVSRIA